MRDGEIQRRCPLWACSIATRSRGTRRMRVFWNAVNVTAFQGAFVSDSECPLDVDPRVKNPDGDSHYLWIVQREVSRFVSFGGIDYVKLSAEAKHELFSAGQVALAKYLKQVDGQEYRLTKPTKYVAKLVRQAVEDSWQRSNTVYIKPSTRRDLVDRGDEFEDPSIHSWHNCFSSSGPIPVNNHTTGRATGTEPHWAESCFARPSYGEQWSELIATLDVIYSLCQNDFDREVVDARLGHLDSFSILPVHVSDVAAQLGIKESSVKECLDRLERRYYKLFNLRLPAKRRRSRPLLA